MMRYQNPQGEWIHIEDAYQADITGDITRAGKQALSNFRAGWFSADTKYPAAVFYQLGGAMTDYYSGHPHSVRFTYYFEVRAAGVKGRDDAARAVCSVLGSIYNARRSQFDDAFEENPDAYIKRITFIFTVFLGKE